VGRLLVHGKVPASYHSTAAPALGCRRL
jgi:hypothetical protein